MTFPASCIGPSVDPILVGVDARLWGDAEAEILEAADRAFAEACERAPGLIACGPGCCDCCHRPFAITEADAERLRVGMRALDREQAAAIEARAAEAWGAMSADFPGEAESGHLDRSAEWRDWFYARHAGRACPVLDPATGACRLHAWRPVACRLYGPLIRIGTSRSEPCPKNYVGKSAAEVEAHGVTVELEALAEEGEQGETVVAFALFDKRRRAV
ncbi:MAG: YkgJ family cysteine cluster protein [Bryobacteraceae bacterium]